MKPAITDLARSHMLIQAAVLVSTALALRRSQTPPEGLPFTLGLGTGLVLEQIALRATMRRAGPENHTLADLLTLSRATSGSILAGLAISGPRERSGLAARLGWTAAIWGIGSDIGDGLLARRLGPTRLGRTLDIEADSWLTLWSAADAVAWGRLPSACLVGPILRYVHPLQDLIRGDLPVGGGPWWGKLTGLSQTILFLAALAPFNSPRRDRLVARCALLVSGAQTASMLLLFVQRKGPLVSGRATDADFIGGRSSPEVHKRSSSND